MPSGPHSQLVTAVAQVVTDMVLTLDGSVVTVETRKKLGVADGFAGSPVLAVAPGRSQRLNLVMGGLVHWLNLSVLVGLISTGRLDLSGLTGELGEHLDWRDALTSLLLDPTTTGLTFVAGVTFNFEPALSDQDIERGQDVSAIEAVFRCLVGTNGS